MKPPEVSVQVSVKPPWQYSPPHAEPTSAQALDPVQSRWTLNTVSMRSAEVQVSAAGVQC